MLRTTLLMQPRHCPRRSWRVGSTTATAYYTVSARISCDVCKVSRNAAARFITGARKYDHITPVLRDLHWLPLRQRITFKIATLMYQCLNGLAPPYLANDCIAISSMPNRRQLRSATSGQLCIPRTMTQ